MALAEHYYVIEFEHIDDFRCFKPLSAVFENDPNATAEVAELKRNLETLFSAAGWEGDGEINCMFLPPCFTDTGFTNCETIYHVKQSNNGTSWIAMPRGVNLQLPEAHYERHY